MPVIDQLPSGRWRARIRRRDAPQQSKSFVRKLDAEAWARKVESEIERGAWRETGDAERMTLKAALDKYAAEDAKKHRGSAAERAHIKVIRDDVMMRLTLDKVKHENVRAMRDRWIAIGYAVGTVNRRLTILHALFERARIGWRMPGLINPVAGLKLKGATQRERRVSDDEIEAIIAASESPALAVFVRLAVETAMRRGELCALNFSMLDLKKHVARLPASITKSGKARDVPLSVAAEECVAGLHGGGRGKGQGKGRVFSLKPHSITQAMMRAVARARAAYVAECEAADTDAEAGFLADLHFHDLRHEATSRLASMFNIQELMKITGHSSSAMLMRYYHPKAEDFAQRMRSESRAARESSLSRR